MCTNADDSVFTEFKLCYRSKNRIIQMLIFQQIVDKIIVSSPSFKKHSYIGDTFSSVINLHKKLFKHNKY